VIKRLKITGFKSIMSAEIELPRLTVLFGPNAAGKSNLLDAVLALSRVGTERTIADALSEPIRGYPVEAFAFPEGGLASLLSMPRASFALEADLYGVAGGMRYRAEVSIQPGSGSLSISDEYLAALTARGKPKGLPVIEKAGDSLRIRRNGSPSPVRDEPVGQNHTVLSDLHLGGPSYKGIEQCRNELAGWRIYYLEPRTAMRASKPLVEVNDIGVSGENVAPFLYRLKAESPKHFAEVRRLLRTLVPDVDDLQVDLDKRRGTLDILIRQSGIDFSSRIISEGTLRVLALCCIAANPWGGSLIAFEEPENGVDPRRIELIAQLLFSTAIEPGRQVIVTSHSPLVCGAMLKHGQKHPGEVALMSVHHGASGTEFQGFDVDSPIFRDEELKAALCETGENGVFQGLMLRGLLDG